MNLAPLDLVSTSRQTAVDLTAEAIAVAEGPYPYDLGPELDKAALF